MEINRSVHLHKFNLTFSKPLCSVGEHLEKLIPVVVKFTNVEDDELREYCFQAFEAFVRRYTHICTFTHFCVCVYVQYFYSTTGILQF